MPRFALLFILLVTLVPHTLGAANLSAALDQLTASPAAKTAVVIISPRAGQALQGLVPISGSTAQDSFQMAELEFAYTHDPTHTWFLIEESDKPMTSGLLTQWDTTTLTDETYDLRLTVLLKDGRRDSVTIAGLRVRNYTPIETDTPTPVSPTSTPVPGDTPVPTVTPTITITIVPPTFTPFPPNPARLSTQDITASLQKGALAVTGIFAMMGVYYLVSLLRKKG